MIRRIYLKMTGPQILASVSSMLCLLIDSIVISRFLGVDAMSAYGLVSPMIIVVNVCILMISCGAQVSAAAAMGRGDMEDLSAGYSTALAGAAGVSLAIMVMVFTAAGSVCGLLGASRSNVPPNVMEMTEQYLKGYFIGTPFFFLVQLATPYLQTMGKRKDLLRSVICMTVSDIVLDILSVTVFYAGIAGIGIASGLSYLAAFLPVSGFFLKKDRIFRFNRRKIQWKTLMRIVVQGGPVFMSFACYFLRVLSAGLRSIPAGNAADIPQYSVYNG